MEKVEKEKNNFSRRYTKEYTWIKILLQFWATFCVLLPVLLVFYRIKIEGRENIPAGSQFITSANHISFLDPFLVFMATRKPTAFMAKKELFEHEKMCWWMDKLGAFSVNREKLEVSTLKTVKDLCKTSWSLGIFPQGGIRRNKKLESPNKGFAVISKASRQDILPISITGCEEYNWVPFKGCINIKIGKPISYQLELEEIMSVWLKQIALMADYEIVAEVAA